MEDSTHIDSTKISLYIQQLEFTVSNLEATITRMKKECFDPKKFYGTATFPERVPVPEAIRGTGIR